MFERVRPAFIRNHDRTTDIYSRCVKNNPLLGPRAHYTWLSKKAGTSARPLTLRYAHYINQQDLMHNDSLIMSQLAHSLILVM